jgi:hypothetical protein
MSVRRKRRIARDRIKRAPTGRRLVVVVVMIRLASSRLGQRHCLGIAESRVSRKNPQGARDCPLRT